METPIFRASEVLDMGVSIEEQGLAFYKACREACPDDDRIITVLNYLIDQENRHKALFLDMKTGLEVQTVSESYPGEMQSYVDGFVRDKVFAKPEKAADAVSDVKDRNQFIDRAIRFEKKSIEFYLVIKKRVRTSEQHVLDEIIREEQDHIRRLWELGQELEHA